MTGLKIREPAEAVAIGRCVVARSVAVPGRDATTQHPRRCGWCDYEPVGILVSALANFFEWAGAKEVSGHRTYARYEASAFAELERHHRADAEALIVAAQGYEAVPDPVTAVEPEPAHDLAPAEPSFADWSDA